MWRGMITNYVQVIKEIVWPSSDLGAVRGRVDRLGCCRTASNGSSSSPKAVPWPSSI
jgi:hypothetical protein